MRALYDYQKVRRILGRLLRNRRFQANRPQLATRHYLQIGCGPQLPDGFINLDYRWVPGIDVVWDLQRALPFPADRFRGIFTEHCLEHFDDSCLQAVLADACRVLQPGGRIRIVVPSLEIHAQRYLAARSDTNGEPARIINRTFYSGHDCMARSRWINDGHHFIHDFATLSDHLYAVGFVQVTRAAYRQGADPQLLVDRADREWESLYVEAIKPPQPR